MSTAILKLPSYLTHLRQRTKTVFAPKRNYISLNLKIADINWRVFHNAFSKEKSPVLLLFALVLAGLVGVSSTFAQNRLSQPGNSSVFSDSCQPGAERTGEVKGIISDVITKYPLAQVTIAIEDKSTGKTVDITDTDENGHFSLNGLPAGQYRLFITNPSYGTTVLDGLSVEKEEVNMGSIGLYSGAEALTQVPVECGTQ